MHVRSDRHAKGAADMGRCRADGKCSTVGCTSRKRVKGMCTNCYNKARLARGSGNMGGDNDGSV